MSQYNASKGIIKYNEISMKEKDMDVNVHERQIQIYAYICTN